MFLSINEEKAFHKLYLFKLKSVSKLKIEGKFFNLIKNTKKEKKSRNILKNYLRIKSS